MVQGRYAQTLCHTMVRKKKPDNVVIVYFDEGLCTVGLPQKQFQEKL